MKKFYFFIFVVGSLLVVMPTKVQAVEEMNVDKMQTTVVMEGRTIAESDVEATNSQIRVSEARFETEFETKVAQKLPLKLSFEIKHVDLINGDPAELPSHLEGRSIGIGTKLPAPFLDSDHYFVRARSGIGQNPGA